jgi:Inosine-uridine preferring nucleoside hydrolase
MASIVAAASALVLGMVLAAPASAAAPTPVIIDQDMFSSADDVGALATAFSLEHAGEANVIAITLNTRTSRPEVATDTFKCAAAIENFYGSHAPIGTQTALGNPAPNAPDFVGPCGQLAPGGASPSGDAVSVMKQALKAQADNSVVIVCTGYERNLADLLQDPEGSALVAQKVSRLVVMGGGYTQQSGGTTFTSLGENNFNGDIAAAQYVAANWPTTVVYSGVEVGDVVHSGAGISGSHPHYSPVRVAYEAFVGENNWIDSHDLTAVYDAIRPNTMLTANGPGNNVVTDWRDPNPPNWDYGANEFTLGTGHHYFLTVPDPTALGTELDGLLDYTPAPTGITAPTNSAAPRIFDTAQQQTLTASPGNWTGKPTAFAYHWEDCSPSGTCTAIPQAIHQTFDVSQVAPGHTVKVQVWASIPGASSAMAESGAGPVPAKTQTDLPATISGTTQEGQTLTASAGTWTNNPTGYTYQWQRCTSGGCSPIANATSQDYKLTSLDVNQTITVQVTAQNAGGSSDPVVSNPTLTVLPAVPSTSAGPSISPPGGVVEGQILSESHAPWIGSPTSFGYQWQSCDGSGNNCSAIPGATGQSYTLTAGDVGHRIRVQETATNAGGPSSPATSDPPTQVVTAAPTPTPAPTPVVPPGPPATQPLPPSGTGPSGPAPVSSAQIQAMLAKAMAVQGPAGKLLVVLKQGGYRIWATAPSAGRLTISWYTQSRGKKVLVAQVTFAFNKAGVKSMKLALTGNGRKLLRGVSKMNVTAHSSFTPSGQGTTSMTKTLSLRR